MSLKGSLCCYTTGSQTDRCVACVLSKSSVSTQFPTRINLFQAPQSSVSTHSIAQPATQCGQDQDHSGLSQRGPTVKVSAFVNNLCGFKQSSSALTTTNTHGHDPVFFIATTQFTQHQARLTRPGHTKRVTDRDAATQHVIALVRQV